MPQPPLLDLSALIVKDRDLLKPRMKITTYNQHDVGSFSSLGLFLANQSTRTCEPTSLCNQGAQRRGTLARFPNARFSAGGYERKKCEWMARKELAQIELEAKS